ncbi:hypothetical protein KI385_07145 [Streptomyces inhibens]|nr:hypothetical protein [Streptomyces inhibens]UKY48590.1 hypothetical protein KI385_07145 [Streptomyces inhibens]
MARAGGLVTVVFRRFFVRMAPDELGRSRDELEAFAAEVFVPLRSSDQQGKGVSYLRGQPLGGRRKSMRPMASGWASTTSACDSSWQVGLPKGDPGDGLSVDRADLPRSRAERRAPAISRSSRSPASA